MPGGSGLFCLILSVFSLSTTCLDLKPCDMSKQSVVAIWTCLLAGLCSIPIIAAHASDIVSYCDPVNPDCHMIIIIGTFYSNSLRVLSNGSCCASISWSYASYLVLGQYPPSTIFRLLEFPSGIIGVKAVSMEPEWPRLAPRVCHSLLHKTPLHRIAQTLS